ncbi:MAG: hypothetical protein V4629_11270 [Pseudomonadota bacterium]
MMFSPNRIVEFISLTDEASSSPIKSKSKKSSDSIYKIAENIRTDLERYLNLLHMQTAEQVLQFQVEALKNWQKQRLYRLYQDTFQDKGHREAVTFVIEDVYGGRDLAILAKEIRQALPIACRILPATLIEMAARAITLNALTAELDQELATHIFKNKLHSSHSIEVSLSDGEYAQALIQTNQVRARIEVLHGGIQLAQEIDKRLRARWLPVTFRMAKKPANMAGFNTLYKFLERSFSVLDQVPNIERLVTKISNKEEFHLKSLE